MCSVKKPQDERLEFKLVSELPPQKQKEIIEALVFIDKFHRTRHHVFPSGELHELVDGKWVKVRW